MAIQRFQQQVTATAGTPGTVTLTFPAVPQGLIWTGSVTLYTPSAAGSAGDNFRPLLLGTWNVSTNTTPLISFGGEGVIYDVQLLGQEVLTLSGSGLDAGTQVTAVWTGYSADTPTDAPMVYPRVYGTSAPFVQVYTDPTQGAGSPLSVAPFPAPADIQLVQGFISGASQSVTLIPAGSVGYSLWDLAVNIGLMNSATTAGNWPFFCSVQVGTGAGATNLFTLEPGVVQSSAVAVAQTINLRGYQVPPGVPVVFMANTFGGTAARANCTLTVTALD